MLNRLSNFQATGLDEPPWGVDAHPDRRLAWLFVLMTLPLLAVIARVAYLQIALPERFTAAFERTTEELEPIPTRDGRILGSDGRVLAYDIEQFSVLAHYRWLETPTDPDWLRQQALSRLGRADRRDPERVAREEQRVLERREAMWQRLAALTGTDPARLARERQAIQRRVERMIARVEEHRNKAARESETGAGNETVGSFDLPTLWQSLKRSLTTPPRRSVRQPVVLREELDYHPVVANVSLEVAAEIESRPELYPGLRTKTATERAYPERTLAAHLIGTRTPLRQEELDARRAQFPQGDPLNYQPGDRIGRTGVERSYDRHVRGLRGLRRIVRNRRGEIVRTEIIREPRMGSDVVLTLNLPLQQRAEELLDATLASSPVRPTPAGGSLVVLDVRTGALVAAASGPRFDLQQYVTADEESWQQLIADPRQPLFHRATQMTVPPGSTFKPLTAVALLESGGWEPDSPLHCRGYFGENPTRNRCYIFTHYGVGHGDTSLSDALCRSCNVYFFDAAERIGPYQIVDWAERFGFGQPTGIDLPGEQGGNLPRPPEVGNQRSEVRGQRSENKARKASPWYPGDTRGLAIGQSRLTVTPIQIARLMAAVANGGKLVTPHVVRGTGPAVIGSGSTALLSPPKPREIGALSAETLQHVREGLERVVSDPQGTGYKTVRLKEIAIAGKTGTAEVGGGRRDHAWFAGYVPADRPRYAFAVVLEHAGSGGAEAGPVARQLVQAMLDLGILAPSSGSTSVATADRSAKH